MPLTKDTILQYAAEYDRTRTASDKSVEEEMKAKLKNQRFLTREDFIKIGIWKSPRQKKRYESNRGEAVRELTALSFTATTEEARLGCLLALNGVSFPLASVILHFAFPDEYPILDFRALWSLGWELPSDYSFIFWTDYCTRLRELAKEHGVDLRTLDKALWQYSATHQK